MKDMYLEWKEKEKENHLKREINEIVEEFLDKIEALKTVEEHASEETDPQNNGWEDFDPEQVEELQDEVTYLVRQIDINGNWKSPHLAYWDAEEEEFVLLHTTTFMAPRVNQYLKVPD